MDKLDRLGWVVGHTYEIAGERFQIRSTSAAFGAWFYDALSAYRASGEAAPMYSVVVPEDSPGERVGRGFNIVYRGSRVLARTLQPLVAGQALLADLESLHFADRDDAVYVEGTFLRSNGVAALAPGVLGPILDGMGRRVAKAGISLPITPFVSIGLESGTIVPVSPILELPGDALAALAAMSNGSGRVKPAPQSDVALVDAPTSADVVVNVVPNAITQMRPTSRGLTLQWMGGRILNLRVLGRQALEAIAALIERAECYELGLADASSALDALRGLFSASSHESG